MMLIQRLYFIIMLMCGIFFETLFAAPWQHMTVCVPVADLRAQPSRAQTATAPALSLDIGGQLSQLVYGEPIRAQQDPKNPGWLLVEALGHLHSTHGNWYNLKGYIQDFQAQPSSSAPTLVVTHSWVDLYADKHKSKVLQRIPFGSRLEGKKSGGRWYKIQMHDGRKAYIEKMFVYDVNNTLAQGWEEYGSCLASRVQQFVGCPYVWGGRSPHNPLVTDQITGYDCSALIHMAYQSCGLRIPRNSYNQFLYSKKLLMGNEMYPGDCLFFGRPSKNGFQITHVMMYLGENKLLNSSGVGYRSVLNVLDKTQFSTAIISVEQALGVSLDALAHGMVCVDGLRKDDTVFLGTYRTMIQKLRSDFLM